MPNVLEYSTIFQPALDKQTVQQSTTGWMEVNDRMIRYNGGAEVKLPSILMDGLADYDRANGFVSGDVTLTWDTYRLTQDRGRTFSIDAMDVDETSFVVTAGTVMGEFQASHVIPEIDAYRYSKLASIAIDEGQSRELAVTATNAANELLADLVALEDNIGDKEVVITVSPIVAAQIAKAGKDFISKAGLMRGALSVEVMTFNDNAIVKVPSRLLNTEIEILDGVSVDQEAGGFKPTVASKGVNWIIATKDAPIAISKTDKVRTFTPDQNQKADAWKVDFRKYHDLWVVKSKRKSIFANIKA